MKRIVAPVLLLAAMALPASAENRGLSGFDSIAAENGVRVDVSVGSNFAVEVTGRDAQYVRTRVDGHTLRISRDLPWFGMGFHDFDGRIRVVMPALHNVSAARGVAFTATGVQGSDMAISSAMGAVVEISGACRALDASVAMGGVLDAKNLHCDTADISASMGGTAEIFAQTSYAASASMGGSIDVSGPGARGAVSTSMGGSVDQD